MNQIKVMNIFPSTLLKKWLYHRLLHHDHLFLREKQIAILDSALGMKSFSP